MLISNFAPVRYTHYVVKMVQENQPVLVYYMAFINLQKETYMLMVNCKISKLHPMHKH